MNVTDRQPANEVDRLHAGRVRRDRLAAIAGMIAGPLFLTSVALLTWWQYDYLRSRGWTVLDAGDVPWPSGLALAEHGWLQMLNFAVAGMLLLAFSRALPHQLPDRPSARAAVLMMTVMSLALISLAAPTDRDFASAPSSWHGWTHDIAFVLVVLASVATPMVTARALRGAARWKPLARTSAAAALLCAVSLFVPSQIGFYLFLITLFGWIALLAARFFRLTLRAAGS